MNAAAHVASTKPVVSDFLADSMRCRVRVGDVRYEVMPTVGCDRVSVWRKAEGGCGTFEFEALNRDCAVARLCRDHAIESEMAAAKARKAGKTITVEQPKHRDRKQFGRTVEGARFGGTAKIVVNKSIRILTENDGGDVTFEIGGTACYGSYNLFYFGDIIGITEKTVTIREHDGGKKHRLDIATFCARNYDGNARKHKNNSEWYD